MKNGKSTKEHYRRISLFYFRKGKNEKRSGRPVEVDDDLIDSDRHSTTREIAEKLRVSRTCIEERLKQLGHVQKLDTWVPRERKAFNATR